MYFPFLLGKGGRDSLLSLHPHIFHGAQELQMLNRCVQMNDSVNHLEDSLFCARLGLLDLVERKTWVQLFFFFLIEV